MSQVFTRTEQIAERIHDIKLRIPEWKVLFTIDGVMDTNSISSFLEMNEEEVRTTLDKLQDMSLVSPLQLGKEQPSMEEEVAEEFPEEVEDSSEVDRDFEEGDWLEEPAPEEKDIETTDEDAEQEEVVEDRIELTPEPPEEEEEEEMITFEEEEDQETFAKDELSDLDEGTEVEEEEKDLTDQDFDQFIGGLLNEEDKEEDKKEESLQFESEEPSLDVEMPTEVEEEQDESDVDFGDLFQEGETDLEVEEEKKEKEEEAEFSPEPQPEVDEAAVEMAPGEALTGKEKTILVVDDSVVIRKMVEIALENEQFYIKSVATGKEALSYLDENTPDLIILDIMLPDVNGLEILKAIKASKQIPVVMLSAKDTPRETSKAKELGADDFIPKPFKDEELVSKVKELVNV